MTTKTGAIGPAQLTASLQIPRNFQINPHLGAVQGDIKLGDVRYLQSNYIVA